MSLSCLASVLEWMSDGCTDGMAFRREMLIHLDRREESLACRKHLFNRDTQLSTTM